MKKNLLPFPGLLLYTLLILVIINLTSFTKTGQFNAPQDKSPSASSYSSDVLDKWMVMQIRLMSVTPANFNGPFVRIYAYSGVAAYAAIYPGLSHKSIDLFALTRLNGMPELLPTNVKNKYHWPSCANAALAFMNRAMFPMASSANKLAIDSLEEALTETFTKKAGRSTVKLSTDYGKLVAQRIFSWAEADGYRNSSDPYKPPTGQGLWKPTAPHFTNAVTPYWGRLRTIVAGSNDHTEPPPPPDYSEDSSSFFYKMVKEVHDVSKKLTPGQKEIALFWKDVNPGLTAPGHWLNILRQVMKMEKSGLDLATCAYALSGIALNDTWISSWKARYQYNLLRPITYIQTVLYDKDWLPEIPTPPHPEYPGGHAAMSAAVAEVLTMLYGNDYSFTDHTYDQFGLQPRTYSSFRTIAKEAADSKVFGGIHYQLSVDIGLQQGKNVTQNILGILLNKKEETGNSRRSNLPGVK